MQLRKVGKWENLCKKSKTTKGQNKKKDFGKIRMKKKLSCARNWQGKKREEKILRTVGFSNLGDSFGERELMKIPVKESVTRIRFDGMKKSIRSCLTKIDVTSKKGK